MKREINNLLRKAKEQSRAAVELETQGDKKKAAAMKGGRKADTAPGGRTAPEAVRKPC